MISNLFSIYYSRFIELFRFEFIRCFYSFVDSSFCSFDEGSRLRGSFDLFFEVSRNLPIRIDWTFLEFSRFKFCSFDEGSRLRGSFDLLFEVYRVFSTRVSQFRRSFPISSVCRFTIRCLSSLIESSFAASAKVSNFESHFLLMFRPPGDPWSDFCAPWGPLGSLGRHF